MAIFTGINKPDIGQASEQKEVLANEAIEALAKGGSKLSKSIAAGGTINLTEEESRWGIIALTGDPATPATVVQHANITKATLYKNEQTDTETVQVKLGAGGTLFTIPPGGLLLLLSATEAVLLDRDIVEIVFNCATSVWTDQPAAETEFLGLTDRRTKFDLTRYSQVRLLANVEVVGFTGAVLKAQYSTDQSTWNDMEDGAGTGPTVLIDALGLIVSSYVLLPSGAKADVFLRIVGVGGDGAVDPEIGRVSLQAK